MGRIIIKKEEVMSRPTGLVEEIRGQQEIILKEWVNYQLSALTLRRDLITEEDLRNESKRFLELFLNTLQISRDSTTPAWKPVKDMLGDMSKSRALLGFSPSETATFVFSLKQPLFSVIQQLNLEDSKQQVNDLWEMTILIDKLGLHTTEVHQQNREQIILRQQQEMLELSTPVVQLWENILALPLIGTLDSARTQVVMESLLQRIVETGAKIAVIDITGVVTVDTLVAQHLMKTVAAARLMGADCIISGIRPQIAQTIVHLGVNLSDIITKATLADAFEIALQQVGAKVTKIAQA
jgi:rsbT co-antagonist protein RsbR